MLAEGVGVALPLCTPVVITEGEISGAEVPGELVHAETMAETRTATMAQLTAASLALAAVPSGIKRTFMQPPYMPSGRPYR